MPNPPTLVLGYHNVSPTAAFSGDDAGLPAFREQLRTIARRCAVVPFVPGEVSNPTRRPTVALTFDDGYLDNAMLVASLLDELGLPATFFLVTSFLDGADYPWWELVAALCAHPAVAQLVANGRQFRLSSDEARVATRQALEGMGNAAPLAERDVLLAELFDSAGAAGAEAIAEAKARTPMMGWAEAKQLVDAGFSVGSHTARHAILAREDAAVVASQLATSKQRLGDELGIEVGTFAYPRGAVGDFDRESVRLVREAGFRRAVTTIPGLNVAGTGPLRLRRLVLEPTMGTTALLRAVAGQLGGAAARALFSLAPAARRVSRTPRPSA